MIGVKVAGTGCYLPEKILTNTDLEKIVDTNDEWITKMTGIKNRHIAAHSQATSDLCTEAGKQAIESAGLNPEDIDMIIVGTSTPDMLFPATACLVQKNLGCRVGIPVFDYEIACSSYVYGIIIGSQFIHTGSAKNILVIAGDIMSRILNYQDRGTCILFGDGASAMVLSSSTENHLLGFDWGANGYEPYNSLYVHGGGSRAFDKDTSEQEHPYVHMDGPEIYRLAVKKMSESITQALENAKVISSMVDYVIPHQANIRIMNSIVKQLNLPAEKLINTIAGHGNASGSTVGIALHKSIENGTIKRGDILALTAFGSGLSWASAIIKY